MGLGRVWEEVAAVAFPALNPVEQRLASQQGEQRLVNHQGERQLVNQ